MRLGEAEFNAATGELRRDGAVVRLEPQPAAVLALLVSRAGELVTHDEIRRAIWGEATHVNFQQSLHYCIRKVRVALGEVARAPQLVETIPRRGYRLSLPPRRDTSQGATRWMTWALAAAVLMGTTLIVEQRPNRHHEIALTVLRAVHGLLY